MSLLWLKKFNNICRFWISNLDNNVSKKNKQFAKKIPMKVVICKKCYLVQLNHNYQLDKLFNNDYGYRSGINKTMNDHFDNMNSDKLD